jgi:hypothetical protein
MSESDSTPASAPASEHTQPAAAPAEHDQDHHQEHYQEQPAETPEHENYEEHEEPADLGEILEDRPKKLSGAQRAKLQKEYLQNELRQREQRISELERHISQSENDRHADAQRKRDDAHMERVKAAKGAISDFDRVMNKMRGVEVHEDLIEEIKASDKSPLLAYHLASHPDKLAELNHMSERQRAREIGRLEATLKMPEGRKQTKAPPPVSNLKGGAAPHTALEQVNDMKEFSKRLMADLDKRRRR